MAMKFKTLKDEKIPTLKNESDFSKAAPQQVKTKPKEEIISNPQKSTKFTKQEIDLLNKYKERTGISRNQIAKLAIMNLKNNSNNLMITPREKATIRTTVLLTPELSDYLKELAKNNLEKEGTMLRYVIMNYIESN